MEFHPFVYLGVVSRRPYVADDPNGFSRPTFDVHVLPSLTALEVPSEFLEPNTPYELEVLALEKSGNQTITVIHFETKPN